MKPFDILPAEPGHNLVEVLLYIALPVGKALAQIPQRLLTQLE